MRHRRDRHRRAATIAPPSTRVSSGGWPARSATAAPTSSASTAIAAPGSRTRGSRSSTWRPASSRSRTRPARCGSSSTARSSTTSSCATSWSARGHRFRTRSDTEVIVHAYEEWGDDAFRRFNGQWAVALWDADRRELVLARDPFGVRPLYIAKHGGRLLLRQRGQGDLRRRRLDPAPRSIPRGLDQIFTFWTTVAPQHGVRGHRGAASRARRASTARTACARRAATTPSFPRSDGRPVPRHARRGGRGGARGARATRPACACCAPTCRSAATCRAGSTARSSRRSACAPRARSFSTFSLRFDDAEYDETEYQRAMAELPRQRSPRGARVARRHRARVSPT